ncbi:MAG: D-alanyl-D-alanine carboxypeptidase [Clostridia bacterium]|nr:D-alanyl-D-alanine carboxypeptidase [Clostridia bacterium]
MKRLVSVFSVLLIVFVSIPMTASAVEVSAKAAVVICGDTGEVLFSKNAEQPLPMASTTKIMTGLLLCEYGNLDREITVTAEMVKVEGSSMGLLVGDRVTLYDLLYGLMLASGNDAANTIAIVMAGSIPDFAELMNNKAKEIGLKNTSFVTPSGLDDEKHYTTAYDLALLTKYAMQNEDFAHAVGSKSAALNYGNPPYRRTLTNHNKLLKMVDGCVGVKTGFTKKSGRCLVSAVKRDGKYVIAVTLNAPNDWQDHKNMLQYGLSKIIQTEITPKKSEYEIPVISGTAESLTVKIKPFLLNSSESEGFSCQVYLPPYLYAPVKKGEVIGKAVYMQNGKVIAKQEILANADIKLYKYQKQNNILKNFLHIAQFILGD